MGSALFLPQAGSSCLPSSDILFCRDMSQGWPSAPRGGNPNRVNAPLSQSTPRGRGAEAENALSVSPRRGGQKSSSLRLYRRFCSLPAVLCLLLAPCYPGTARPATEEAARPSVILISIDTLRADRLSAYGYTKIRTPHIDSFAQGGTLFTQAEAQIPLTLPSHLSLFTSTYPFQNRVEENGERVPAGVVTLASVLQSHGYQTAAFIGSDFLDRRYGLDQGFDYYDSPFRYTNAFEVNPAPAAAGQDPSARPQGAAARAINPLALSIRRDGALVVRAALQWLAGRPGPLPIGHGGATSSRGSSVPQGGQPVFIFVHLFDLHVPYTLPAEVARQQGISRYDAQLEYVDQVMGHFQQELMRSGWWDKSLVVVFGDHGEGLGDHRETDHGYYIYESTLHVPLIFHWPHPSEGQNSKLENGNSKIETRRSKLENRKSKIEDGSSKTEIRNSEFEIRNSKIQSPKSKIENPVGLIDVAPTILDYLRLPAPASFAGASLLGALMGGDAARASPVYSESLYAHDAFGWAPLRSLRVGKYKYIRAPKAELYDLQADPRERLNLLSKNAAMEAELEDELAKLLARYAPAERSAPAALAPETLAELESLGYLAVATRGASASAGPDPKDRFAEFELYQTAFEAFSEGHTAAALPGFQSILKTDPQNTLARFHLGEGYLRLQRPQDALREWETVLELDPQYAPAAEAIGQYWLEQGDYAKARRRFQQVLALTPESYTGHFLLAHADEHLGLLPEARRHLEIACQIAPHDENCARELQRLMPK